MANRLRVGWAPIVAMLIVNAGTSTSSVFFTLRQLRRWLIFRRKKITQLIIENMFPILEDIWLTLTGIEIFRVLMNYVLLAPVGVLIQRLLIFGEEPTGIFHLRLGYPEFQYAAASTLLGAFNFFVMAVLLRSQAPCSALNG